jgi:hypothetical protein
MRGAMQGPCTDQERRIGDLRSAAHPFARGRPCNPSESLSLDIPKLVPHVMNWWIGALTVIYAVQFTLLRLSQGYGFLESFYYYWTIAMPIGGGEWYGGLFPVSAVMLGILLIAMDLKFGWRALALVGMAAGSFDLAEIPSNFALGLGYHVGSTPQVVAVLLGWVVAGMPSIKTGTKWFWVTVLAFVLFPAASLWSVNNFFDYHIAEAFWYVWLYTAITPVGFKARYKQLRGWLTKPCGSAMAI